MSDNNGNSTSETTTRESEGARPVETTVTTDSNGRVNISQTVR